MSQTAEAPAADTRMTPVQRKAIVALCVAVGVTYLVSASMTFTLAPMMADLGMTSAEGDLLMSLPAIASLLIVFAAGRLGDRLGHRSMIVAFAVPFVAGGIIVASAPNGTLASVGVLFAGGCATAIQVISLGLLQQTFTSGPARVSAFTSFGMMFPAIYVVMPVVTGHLVDIVSWRWIPVIWAVAGALVPLIALRMLPEPGPRKPLGELATPLLAGLVLAALVSNINHRSEDGWLTPRTVSSLVVAVVALVVLIIVMRRLAHPSLSLTPLRIPQMKPLLVCVAIVMCVNTLVYVTLGVQYLYSLNSLKTAWAIVPAQVGAVLGAKVLASIMMRRYGALRSGLFVLVAFAISYLTLLFVQSDSSVWVPVAAATIFSVFGMAMVTILNTAVMGHAPDGQQGLVSSYRGAASAIGGALSVVALGTGIVDAVNKAAAGGPLDVGELVSGFHSDAIVGAVLVAVAFAVYAWTARSADN